MKLKLRNLKIFIKNYGNKLCMVTNVYNPSTLEAEIGRL
jgi:hypothetical protein